VIFAAARLRWVVAMPRFAEAFAAACAPAGHAQRNLFNPVTVATLGASGGNIIQ